jgi:hypothetical protein
MLREPDLFHVKGKANYCDEEDINFDIEIGDDGETVAGAHKSNDTAPDILSVPYCGKLELTTRRKR